MNPRELVDHIRSGPAVLTLDEPLRFRRRRRSNPCDFNDFLQALQSSETIRDVWCYPQQKLGLTGYEWVLLVKALGRIRDIQSLGFDFDPGSRDFHPFQAVADAVNSAHSLRKLVIGLCSDNSPRDLSGLTALTYALREHTALQQISLMNWRPYNEEAAQSTGIDPVLQALRASACPRPRTVFIRTTCASTGAIKELLQLGPATVLHLSVNTELCLAVADGIRQGRCNIKGLCLDRVQSSSIKDAEAVKAIASAIRLDRNLEHLTLVEMNDFTGEAGVALAEALTVNKTLCKITLSNATLCSQAYNAFSAMLRVNTSLVLRLAKLEPAGCSDHSVVDSYNQMVIERHLNDVGRGRLLSSSQTPRKEWVDALNELNSDGSFNFTPELNVSCLFSLLKLNPSVCLLELNYDTNSGV